MTILGEKTKVHRKMKFLVEIPEFGSAKFTTCSGLNAEADEVVLEEGGDPVGLCVPGGIKYGDITLTKGAADEDLFAWWLQVHDYSKGGGDVDEDLMRDIEIVQYDRNNAELRRWVVYMTWPKSFSPGDWDSGDKTSPQIQTLVLKNHGFDQVDQNA